jgi:hypothetical protein
MLKVSLRVLGALPVLLLTAIIYAWASYHINTTQQNATSMFAPAPPVVVTQLAPAGGRTVLALKE